MRQQEGIFLGPDLELRGHYNNRNGSDLRISRLIGQIIYTFQPELKGVKK